VEATPLTLAPGDRLLICSDGLWDEVPESTLLGLLAGGDTPRQCATALVAAADDAGGSDNSTAVVVFVRGSEPGAAPGTASA
jgi:protein phosphatase